MDDRSLNPPRREIMQTWAQHPAPMQLLERTHHELAPVAGDYAADHVLEVAASLRLSTLQLLGAPCPDRRIPHASARDHKWRTVVRYPSSITPALTRERGI